MSSPELPGALDLAIEAVVDAQDENLIRNLIDFLVEHPDGTSEYSKFMLTLQNALGNHEEAIEIAQVVAERESKKGNYRIAQDILLKTYRECRMKRIPLPMEFKESIMILHSYALVKILLRVDDHEGAARMLARVSQNINRFPAHKISILTAATTECYRTGQFRNAKEFALILTRPENQPSVDPKYLPSIEQIAAGNLEDEGPTACSSCPYCKAQVEDYNLTCDDCKRILPFCIASGKHMVINGWTECPHCHFPAIFLHFKKLLAITKCCPMCNEIVESNSLAMKRIDNALVVPKDEVLSISPTRDTTKISTLAR